MSCLSCPGSLLGTCLVQPVSTVLSQLSCPRCPVQTSPSCAHLPCPGNLVHSPPDASVMFLAVLSSLSFPGSPVRPTCSYCPVQTVLSWLPCPSCPVLSHCHGCPVLAVLPCCHILAVLPLFLLLSVLSCLSSLAFKPSCPKPAVLLGCPVPAVLLGLLCPEILFRSSPDAVVIS
jgi:hypothetical protein